MNTQKQDQTQTLEKARRENQAMADWLRDFAVNWLNGAAYEIATAKADEIGEQKTDTDSPWSPTLKDPSVGLGDAEVLAPDVGKEGLEDLYYIQDTRSYVGNSLLWWAAGGRGYTTHLDEAGKLTLEQAMKQHEARGTDLPWPVSQIDRLARQTVDMHHAPSIQSQVRKINRLRRDDGRGDLASEGENPTVRSADEGITTITRENLHILLTSHQKLKDLERSSQSAQVNQDTGSTEGQQEPKTRSTSIQWPTGVMDRESTLKTLIRHNEWRRGGDGPQADPKTLGLALEAAIAAIQNEGTTEQQEPGAECPQVEIERLRELCGCAYQMAGYHDAPEAWLDALGDAAAGVPARQWRVKADDLVAALLPYMPDQGN